MGFNKRFFNKENIIGNSKRLGFNAFDIWVLSPDASFASDNFSQSFLSIYQVLPKGYRKVFHEEMKKIENYDLLFSLVKMLLVNYNEKNNEFHKEYIERYNKLFFSRWSNSITASQAYTITKIIRV
jgi:hypothetical protein